MLFALYTVALLSVCLWAFIKGCGPERAIAATLLAMLVIDQGYHLATNSQVIYVKVDYAHTAIDLAGAVALVVIALQANRVYPLCMAAVQIISLLSHFARGQIVEMGQLAYGILMQAPSSSLIALLALGTAAHVRRAREYGTYRSWRQPYNPSPGRAHVG